MAQSKIEKIASIEDEIRQLKECQKQLLQQHNAKERKDTGQNGFVSVWGFLKVCYPIPYPSPMSSLKSFLKKP